MADGRGGADSPSNTATGRQGNPAVAPPPLDGAFLLQLLQKPTQPAAPSSLPQHHFDPAVAAVGPSHPFLLHEPRHPPPAHFPEPLLFSSHPFSASPGLFPPRGFLPLGGSEVSGSGGPGNLPFFPFDHQTLGVSVGGVLPLAASPPRNDHIQRLGQFPSDRTLVDHMVTSRNLLGPQGNKERSPFRPPPGFQRPQEGGATEGDRESATRGGSDGRLTREQGKAQEERSSGSVQRNRPLYGGRERNSALQKPMMEGQRRLPDHVNQLQDFQRSVTGNKRDGNYKVRIASQSEEVPVHHPPIIDVTLRNDTSDGNSQGKHEYSPDDHVHRNQIFASQRCNSSTAVLEKDAGESDQDSECEADGEDNIALMQKLGIKDKSVIANYSTKNKIPTQDHLEMDSTMLELDHEVEKIVAPSTNSRSKEIRSDLSRGHRVSTQRVRMMRRTIRCRYDIEGLNPSLLSIFQSLVPAEEEKAKQKKLLLSLQDLVNKEWPNAKLYLYGSCANTFGVSKSDIDVCLAIDNHDLSKSDILLKLAEILESGNLQNVQALTRARVPIVKLMDPVTELSCDICVNNLLAVVNTKLLKDYAQIDERLRQLVFIVKHWAKSRRVNETYQGTLSSYAYVLMCIHFLQQRRPAILPCLQAMDATYSVTVDNTKYAYFDQVGRLRNFGSRNKESIPRLLWAFFQYWAYHHDYANDVISIRTGSIISKQAKDWTRRIGNDRHLICIEDPFDTSHDLGRVVDKYSIKILREEFERAAEVLQFDPSPCVTLFEPYMPGSMQR